MCANVDIVEDKLEGINSICGFIQSLSSLGDDYQEVLKWLFDAEFCRTYAQNVPKNIRAALLAVDPEQKFIEWKTKKIENPNRIHVNNEMIPYQDVQSVIDRVATYDASKGNIIIDFVELEKVKKGQPGKHLQRLIEQAKAKKLDYETVNSIQSINEERRNQVLDFLEIINNFKPKEHSKQALSWLRNLDNSRENELTDEIKELLSDANVGLAVLGGDLLPEPDAQQIIDITVNPRKNSPLPVYNPQSLKKYIKFGKSRGED